MMIDLNGITGGKLADTLWGSRIEVPTPSPANSRERTAPNSSDRRQEVDELVGELSRQNAAAGLRLRILALLERFGPRASSEIPRSWPVTRQHIRAAVDRLIADGLVERINECHAAVVRATTIGRRVVEEITRNAAIDAETDHVRGRWRAWRDWADLRAQ